MNKGYEFCQKMIDAPESPSYIKKQMRIFMDLCEGKSDKYVISTEKVKQLENITKILVMPKGLKAGQPLYECLCGYQWLFLIGTLCTVYRSNLKKRRYETGILEIGRKNFKALSLDTPIPTPEGWKTMGEIKPGDYIFGLHGNPVQIIGESEIFNKPMYEVEFEDGEVIKASEDHIWTVTSKTSIRTAAAEAKKRIGPGKQYREGGWHEKTTKEMVGNYVHVRADGKGNEYTYHVPIAGPVEYPEKDLPIDPYLLGVWLGDGSKSHARISIGDEDKDEMLANLRAVCDYTLDVHHCKDRADVVMIDRRPSNVLKDGDLLYELRKLGVLNNKHIPRIYLQASVKQRQALLQGLMDTDGTCSPGGQCGFIQNAGQLADDVIELVRSLGFKATMAHRMSMMNGEKINPIQHVQFYAPKSFPVFRLKRKYENQKEELKKRKYKAITAIREIPAEPSKCIMVDDPDHLYLAGKTFTPTHNTFTIATIFIFLFLTEPQFSKFYSVAPVGAQSREIQAAIAEMIRMSPLIYEYKSEKRFKILRDSITFKPLHSEYIPLSYSTSTMDSRLPNAFCADEVGGLPIAYPVEAMRSGQLNILNKLGFIISTKYPTIDNPMEDEVAYAKRVLDGLEPDETVFALLYEPDETKGWETNDLILKQANPVSLEVPEIWEDLLKKRAKAVAVESARENFVTKHCNIIYQGQGTETYVDVNDVMACRRAKVDWRGRTIYVGLDLSQSDDNTSVSIAAVDDDNNILADSWAFIPEGRIDEKTANEKVDYRRMIQTGKVIPCGDRVIDYAVVEKFVQDLPEKLGVAIQAVGYDRWNAISSAQKLEAGDEDHPGLNMVEIRQHSSVLHPPTKLLKEKILNGEFQYEPNPMLEINFQNARCVYDNNKNLWVNKKKSRGKIDMCVALIDAVYLLEQDCLFGQDDFVVQVL